jgi:phospholipase/carboxylesterase
MSGSPPPLRELRLPFTTATRCLLSPPRAPGAGRPPLLISLHGQGQSGERQARWMAEAVPPHFAAAWPDGFHAHEVRKPERPIRLGHGWYLYTGDEAAFRASLLESEAALWRLIGAAIEELGADPSRLWLHGFSQGAYLAHCVACRAPSRLRGWIAQAGRLKWEFLGERIEDLVGKPVLVQHGRNDRSLALERAERGVQILRESGADVDFRVNEGGHEITPQTVAEVRDFLARHEPAR